MYLRTPQRLQKRYPGGHGYADRGEHSLSVLNNLPPQLTSFIGRERELAEVREILGVSRLLSLTGEGGSGKTRLALRTGSALLEEDAYPDGVWFVDLAPLSDSGVVPQAVASVLGVREEAGRSLTETLAEHLQERNLLLIIDNCEHLLTACAHLVDALLKNCPHLQILATSRQALGVDGEIGWHVPSLSMPNPGEEVSIVDMARFDSVQLFVARALYSRPSGFTITPRNAPVVAQLCHRLDGIPLALELAAARVKVLSVEQIVERLDERFRLLTGGNPAALPRQQTLRALIDWSYDLLTEEEQVLLRCISVFVGGFILSAVEAICGGEQDEYETLDLLSHLVDKSLVLVEDREGVARYRLHETIRQYGWGKLKESGDIDRVRTQHSEWYAGLAQEAQVGLVGDEQDTWLNRLETEHDNIRAALEWSTRGSRNAETALRISSGVWRFWDTRGYITEGRRWLDDALAVDGEASLEARSRALSAAGNLAYEQGDWDRARLFHTEALELRRKTGDKRAEAGSLANLGVLERSQGNFRESRQLYEESLQIFRDLRNLPGVASVLNGLGFLAQNQDDYDRAEKLYHEALSYTQEVSDKQGLIIVYNNLGEVAQCRGDYERAEGLFDQALTIAQELGDKVSIVGVLNNQGSLENVRGNYALATRLYRQSLVLAREVGLKQGIAEALEGVAVAQAREHRERALHLMGASEALRQKIGGRVPSYKRAGHDQNVARVRKGLSEKTAEEAWVVGRLMSLDTAIEVALRDPEKPEGEYADARDLSLKEVALTRREVDVLRLVAAGLTDAQVAQRLTLSTRTINAHMQSIFGKLEVTSRNAATRWAIEHGIAEPAPVE